MSFEPQKVIEFDKGKQIGQTLTQHADNIPYEDTTVGAELDSINTHLSGLDTEVDSKLDAIKVLFTGTTQINIGGGSGDIFFTIRLSATHLMQIEFHYQNGIDLNVSTDNGASWTTYWRK